jgi:hypothetical protein
MPARIAAMGDLYAPVLNTPQRFPDTFEGYTASGEEEGG